MHCYFGSLLSPRPLDRSYRPRCIPATLLMFFVVLLTMGCAKPAGLPNMVHVRGQVIYQGEPLRSGTVVYVPRSPDEGRQARGEIQPDGTFVLTTLRPGDGVQTGEYDIAVVALAAHPGELSREAIEAAGGVIKRGYLIPDKYAQATTSGIHDTVDKSHSGVKVIEIRDR